MGVTSEYVTATVGGQLFGLPIDRVQDVFVPTRLTRVPLADPEIAGVLNLRGRIVTLIDLRRQLGFAAEGDAPLAIGVDVSGESYGFLVDTVGEVLQFPASGREDIPVNLAAPLRAVATGLYRLQDQLMIVLDVDRLLQSERRAA